MARVTGVAADWLAGRRDELNLRFRQARKHFGRLEPEQVLALSGAILPPLAGSGEPGAERLLYAAFDLILLHAGRGLLAQSADSSDARAGQGWADVLLRETFVQLRPILLKEPRRLTGALSNAAENLGPQAPVFVREIVAVGGGLEEPQGLLDAGAVLAWRLGEARLREEALRRAAALPPRVSLNALGLNDWPAEAAPPVLAALETDAWRHPREVFRPETVARLACMSPAEREALRARLVDSSVSSQDWKRAAAVENFSGFGGHFDAPPMLLDPGATASRHRFLLVVPNGTFRLDADVFGCASQPQPDTDRSVQTVATRGEQVLAFLKGQKDRPRLYGDGRLEGGGLAELVPAAAGAASYHLATGLIAITRADSFRVQVFVRSREPL
jgi:hypothetical protein